jgi:hypothetical protein
MKSDLSKVKKGDKIWTIQHGLIEVERIEKYDYPVYAGGEFYMTDGKLDEGDKFPSAFLEYPFKEQEIEKDTLVWFRDNEQESWRVGYYSHFKDGNHWCFCASKKSTEKSDMAHWHIVTTENPLT